VAAPGIIAAWTAADIADLPPIDFRDPAAEALRPYRQPLLADLGRLGQVAQSK
jgi:hypothetical protein